MKGSSNYLSAVVITYNEAEKLAECLQGLTQIADEIIVVDSYSTDETPEICQNFRVRFFQQPYQGQVEQKLFALSLTKYEHVIALDGDEVMSKELIQSILVEKKNGFPAPGYSMNRRSFYCGKWIRHGDWFPDWKLRLWNKTLGIWAGSNPHDKVILNKGKPQKLNGLLYHYTFKCLEEHEKQVSNYAKISAQSYYEEKRQLSNFRMILSPIFFLIKSYIIKRGFLDGELGWQITRLAMKEKRLKYKLLRTLESNRSNP